MAHRYWVTETVQTFDSKGVRVFKKDEVLTFDSLTKAATHISLLRRHPPIVVGGRRVTQRVSLEGQEIPPAHATVPYPVLHKCPRCGSSTVYFYDASVSAKMYCSACGGTFMADDGTVR